MPRVAYVELRSQEKRLRGQATQARGRLLRWSYPDFVDSG